MKYWRYNKETGTNNLIDINPEEIAQMEAIEEVEIPYEQRVVSLIRERYSIDDEIAINRQRETKPEEWQEYFDYCEECKLKFSYLKK